MPVFANTGLTFELLPPHFAPGNHNDHHGHNENGQNTENEKTAGCIVHKSKVKKQKRSRR